MIRIGGILIGLFFAGVVLLWSFLPGAIVAVTEETETAPEYIFHLDAKAPEGGFAHEGPLGKWNLAQLQRGYQVYKEVCAACHGLKYVAFRDLEELGFSEAQVKAEAATWMVPGINPDTGETVLRPGLATDRFPSPYPNNIAAAAANNNAIPPDLSLITKARKNGSNYVYSLLAGYRLEGPTGFEHDGKNLMEMYPEFETPPGLHFNPYFETLNLAMAPPIVVDGQVTYNDGMQATVPQMSADVAAFLTWAGEPTLVERKKTGWVVLGFVLFATILAWLAKKQIWAAVKTSEPGNSVNLRNATKPIKRKD